MLLVIVGVTFSYNDKLTPLKCASRTRLKPFSGWYRFLMISRPPFSALRLLDHPCPLLRPRLGPSRGPFGPLFGPGRVPGIRSGGPREPILTPLCLKVASGSIRQHRNHPRQMICMQKCASDLYVNCIVCKKNLPSVLMTCIQQKQKRMSSKRPWCILRSRDSM